MQPSLTPPPRLINHKRVELIDKKKVAKAALNENVETFFVHVSSLGLSSIHPARKAQIAFLLTQKVIILSEYSDFSDVFLEEKASELPEITNLNQHAIKLEEGKQPLYGPIYSLRLVEIETLKTYIETNLANGFI